VWNEILRHLCGEAEELIQLAFEWPHLALNSIRVDIDQERGMMKFILGEAAC
jgi:hypothetical protein